MAAAFVPGTVLAGKYRVDRVLGSGGMGVVLAATHLQLDERVAIKLLRPEVAERAGSAERFIREARAAVKIRSEHVVRVLDVAQLEDGTPYIAMELLEGCDLAAHLAAEGPLPVATAIGYVLEACDAVAKAHAMGVVHRDLKPGNLFLAADEEGEVRIKVLDFGIAKFLGPGVASDAALTSTAGLLGSPIYMSPEQLEAARDVDARTDVWSLGVILFELVSGAQPFVADSLPLLFKRILERPAPSLRSVREDTPELLDAVVARCLSKRREDRYADAAELASALVPLAPTGMSPSMRRAPRPSGEATPPASGEPLGRSSRIEPKATAISTHLLTRGGASPRRAAAVAALALAAAGSFFGITRWRDAHSATPDPLASAGGVVAATPLAAPGAVLACPQLRASGVEEPAGWLGAAASGIACMRAQMRMGGRSDRVRVPAELLDLPHEPLDAFPRDPYGAPQARERAIAAAKERAAAFLDGDVVRNGTTFRVVLTLRAPDGRELGRGEGSGRMVHDAVRAAMAPLERAGAIPAAPDHDPFLEEWYRVPTADAAEALADFVIGTYTEDERSQASACASILERKDVGEQVMYYARTRCASAGYGTRPPAATSKIDASSPGALAYSIVGDLTPVPGADEAARAARNQRLREAAVALRAAFGRETVKEGRALLAAYEAEVLMALKETQSARERVLVGLHEHAGVVGVLAPQWRSLEFLSTGPEQAPAHAAWEPWDPLGHDWQSELAATADERLRQRRRAYVIAGDGWALFFGDELVEEGRREEARAVAAQTNDLGLRMRVEAMDAHFARALDLAAAGIPRFDTSKPREGASAMFAAYVATEIAGLLGRQAHVAEPLFERFIAPEPAPIARLGVGCWLHAIATCAAASPPTSTRCLARLRELSVRGELDLVMGLDVLLDGAERSASGDVEGAAKAWRPLLRQPGFSVAMVRDLLAATFARVGEGDLAEKVDAGALTLPGRYNGAELAHARAAVRAAKNGDKDQARKLARRVIDAWSVADEPPPAVAEMRKLLEKLR